MSQRKAIWTGECTGSGVRNKGMFGRNLRFHWLKFMSAAREGLESSVGGWRRGAFYSPQLCLPGLLTRRPWPPFPSPTIFPAGWICFLTYLFSTSCIIRRLLPKTYKRNNVAIPFIVCHTVYMLFFSRPWSFEIFTFVRTVVLISISYRCQPDLLCFTDVLFCAK